MKKPCYPCAIGKSHVSPIDTNSKQPDSIAEKGGKAQSEESIDRPNSRKQLSSKHSAKKTKSHRSRPLASSRGELVFTDVEGPIPVASFAGNKYAIHFTDAYSRFTVTYFMKSTESSEIAACLQQYIAEYYSPRGIKIGTIQTDGASYYVSRAARIFNSKNKFVQLCGTLNIQLRHSSPYCHWENGVAERVIRTLMEKSFTLMAQRECDSRHWEHSLSHVSRVNNMLPHSAFGHEESPYFRWFEKIPNGRYLQIFGCDVRVNTPKDYNPLPRKYIDPPGHISKYIGFNYDSVEHMCWNFQKYQTRQNPIEHVGNDQCKFFRILNSKLYVVPHGDPAYAAYVPQPLDKATPKEVRTDQLPPPKGVRVAKTYKNKLYFGTATKNSGGKFCYDVRYDDTDFEHFVVQEFEEHTTLFRDAEFTPHKQVESEYFTTVTDFTKIDTITNMKIIVEHNVEYAALECSVSRRGGDISTPAWFQLGALIKVNTDAETRQHNWTVISDYLMNNPSSTKLLFHPVTVKSGSKTSSRRNKRQVMLAAYLQPCNNNTVTCVLSDGTHVSYNESQLDDVIVHVNSVSRKSLSYIDTFTQHDGSPVTKTTYCPHSYYEVLKCINRVMWMAAIENCVLDLRKMSVGIWKKVKDLSKDAKPISSRFVCQSKLNHEFNKWFAFARWTPRGFEQIPDSSEDYDGHYDPDNIFAGTPSLSVLRILLAKKVYKRWRSFHFDFKRAFSSMPLDRTIDVLMPKGYKVLDEDGDELYIELTHACEGLKQSGANWLGKVTTYLTSLGFVQSITEPKLFTRDLPDGGRCEFMLYIDDILGICSSPSYIISLHEQLNKFCECKNMGEITSTLGIDVSHTLTSVSLSQESQINTLLHRHDMEECIGRDMPIPPTFKITEALEGKILNAKDKKLFQSLVGSYLYLARNTRPDINHATWLLACCMSAPTEPCLKAAIYLLRYLSRTKSLKLTYHFNGSSGLCTKLCENEIDVNYRIPTGFCDSNWAAPHSVSFTLVMWMNAALLWKVHRQSRPALSTVESELCALSEQAREMEYIAKIFTDLAMKNDRPLPIYCDNRGAIENAKHPILKDNLKHVAIREFFVRSSIDRGIVTVHKIQGTMNPADVGTKPLAHSLIVLYRDFLLNIGSRIIVKVKSFRKSDRGAK
jgi:hypothetical protein